MFLVAALLFLHFHAKADVPQPTCGLHIVSVRFIGAPGADVTYDGEHYLFPKSGSLEVLYNHKQLSFETLGNTRKLAGPVDAFGAMTIILPQRSTP